jgi:DNA polymerase III epsilon subunit-like protein
MLRYLVLDTETGGFGTDKSLLTVGMVVTDENFDILSRSRFDIALIPDDRVYRVDPEALEVNKINLVELSKRAMTYKEGGTTLYEYLREFSEEGKLKLIPVGKQVDGDIARIQQYLVKKQTWEQFVSYRHLDVSAVFLLMQNLRIFPEDASGSLKYLLDFYGLDSDKQHDALADAIYTLQVLKKMKRTLTDNGLTYPGWQNIFYDEKV